MILYIHNIGRFGNNLFQYFTAKIIQKLYGHKIVYDKSILNSLNYYMLTDKEWIDFEELYCKSPELIKNHVMTKHNIVLNGYFQRDKIFLKFRPYLINLIHQHNFAIINQNVKVSDLCKQVNKPDQDDLVLHLRLDDFIHNGSNSHIIHPQSYIDVIEKLCFQKLYIVVDKLRTENEKKYLAYFNKFNPTLIQQSFIEDFNFIRHSNRIIGSNSTFCWLAMFLGNQSERYIPYIIEGHQSLRYITNTDIEINYRYTNYTDL